MDMLACGCVPKQQPQSTAQNCWNDLERTSVDNRMPSQVFVRPLTGATLAVTLPNDEADLNTVLQMAAVRCGLSSCVGQLGLEYEGRQLDLSHSSCGLHGATLKMTGRMLGGKPAQVRLLNTLPCGPSVTVDIEDDTPMFEVKLQLQALTGVPVAAQKVMLQGVGQIVMGDKRTNIGYTHSATTGSFYLGLLGNDSNKA